MNGHLMNDILDQNILDELADGQKLKTAHDFQRILVITHWLT
jgi:hypothetical protein